MKFQGKLLAQARPSGTSAVSGYSPPSNFITEITRVLICNTSGSNATFRLFLDDDGTTYDQTTALFWDKLVLADDVAQFPDGDVSNIFINSSSGNLGIRTSVGNALTFNIFGFEHRFGQGG